MSLTNYNGLQIPSTTPTGDGGYAISKNFQDLIVWNPKSNWAATSNPTSSNNESSPGYYYPGSMWLNTSSEQLFLCLSSGTMTATWQQIPLQSGTFTNGDLAGFNSNGQIVDTGIVAANVLTGLSGGTGISVSGSGHTLTVTNTGVTSNVDGTGISVNNGGTGAVTITNTGVTSLTAGSGTTISASTGAVTIGTNVNVKNYNPSSYQTDVYGGVFAGIGSTVTFTPSFSGRVKLFVSALLASGQQSYPTIQIQYGTGTAPSAGATSITGTQAGISQIVATMSYGISLGGCAVVWFVDLGTSTPLTTGTAYWFDFWLQIAGSLYYTAIQSIQFRIEEY